MSYWEAIILGIVQGITEFLPISSTAHIVIVQQLLGLYFPGLVFEIFLHQASILAVILFFRKDLIVLIQGFLRFLARRRPEDRVHFYFGIYIVVATFITGVLGLLLQNVMGDGLKSPLVVSAALATTGVFLILIERVRQLGNVTVETMGFRHAVIVGLAQTVAVLPGISRSGATLVASLWCGLNRETAVRYSFLLAIPVILGSSVLALRKVDASMIEAIGAGPLLVSFVMTFIFSVIGIVWLIDFLKRGKLLYFAIYCFLVSGFVFFYFDRDMTFDVIEQEEVPADILD